MWRKRLIQGDMPFPALRFQTCRLLEGNVWNRELTIIQRRILQRLRKKKRSIKRKIYSRENLNSYIQSQTRRKLSLFHGDLPITEMDRRIKGSYIPFLLNPETRSDVIPVRLHFRESIPQARHKISHRRVCVNNRMVKIIHFKVSHGDIISFQENDAHGEEIRRFFYIEILVEKFIGKFIDCPVRIFRRTKTEWFRKLKTKKECLLLLKSQFLQELRSSIQEEEKKKFGSKKVCLGSYIYEHKRMKRNFYHFKSLFKEKRRKEKKQNIINTVGYRIKPFCGYMKEMDSPFSEFVTDLYQSIVYSSFYRNSTYCSASPLKFTMKRKRKRIFLPTHYSEVNHRTPKAVVSYGPKIGHIPHLIRLKDPNLLLLRGKERGQNI